MTCTGTPRVLASGGDAAYGLSDIYARPYKNAADPHAVAVSAWGAWTADVPQTALSFASPRQTNLGRRRVCEHRQGTATVKSELTCLPAVVTGGVGRKEWRPCAQPAVVRHQRHLRRPCAAARRSPTLCIAFRNRSGPRGLLRELCRTQPARPVPHRRWLVCRHPGAVFRSLQHSPTVWTRSYASQHAATSPAGPPLGRGAGAGVCGLGCCFGCCCGFATAF